MSEMFNKGRLALNAVIAKHSAVCCTRPLLTVRAYYSSSHAIPLYIHGEWVGWWVGEWEGYGCVRVGVPNQLRNWLRWSGHERNHLGDSC